MRLTFLMLGCAAILATSSCAKKTPLANVAPVTAPQTAPQPESRPAPVQQPASAVKQVPQQQAASTSAPKQMPAEVRLRLEDALARMEDALFDYDKATIRPDAMTALQKDAGIVREILSQYPQERLRIEGHADQRGSDEYNLALGDRRAEVAKDFLAGQGVPSAQLEVISYGKQRPACTESTEVCFQKNRRAHLALASK